MRQRRLLVAAQDPHLETALRSQQVEQRGRVGGLADRRRGHGYELDGARLPGLSHQMAAGLDRAKDRRRSQLAGREPAVSQTRLHAIEEQRLG